MNKFLKNHSKCVAIVAALFFSWNMLVIPVSYAQLAFLPPVGTMVNLTSTYNPLLVEGIKLYPDNPFKFDFIVDTGDQHLNQQEVQFEAKKMAGFFLASLTTPEKEMWVNLSPYEKSRIIPTGFGQTEMGKELLAQDYLLKQIMATALYPERQLGREFWQRVYKEAADKFGTTNVPVSTFNKVWIVPDQAEVYENENLNAVFVVKSRLKVMLEQDYLAANKHKAAEQYGISSVDDRRSQVAALSSNVIKEVVIPALEKEVNEGKNFAKLRQIYQTLVLATWYKKNLRDTVLAQGYVDRQKVKGINVRDPHVNQKIYEQYLKAYRKGVYNYIKEEVDPVTQTVIPRKYFSGGASFATIPELLHATRNPAMQAAMRERLGRSVDDKELLSIAWSAELLRPAVLSADEQAIQKAKKAIEESRGIYQSLTNPRNALEKQLVAAVQLRNTLLPLHPRNWVGANPVLVVRLGQDSPRGFFQVDFNGTKYLVVVVHSFENLRNQVSSAYRQFYHSAQGYVPFYITAAKQEQLPITAVKQEQLPPKTPRTWPRLRKWALLLPLLLLFPNSVSDLNPQPAQSGPGFVQTPIEEAIRGPHPPMIWIRHPVRRVLAIKTEIKRLDGEPDDQPAKISGIPGTPDGTPGEIPEMPRPPDGMPDQTRGTPDQLPQPGPNELPVPLKPEPKFVPTPQQLPRQPRNVQPSIVVPASKPLSIIVPGRKEPFTSADALSIAHSPEKDSEGIPFSKDPTLRRLIDKFSRIEQGVKNGWTQPQEEIGKDTLRSFWQRVTDLMGKDKAMAFNPGGIDLERMNIAVGKGTGRIKTAFSDPKILKILLERDGLLPKINTITAVTVPMINMYLGLGGSNVR